jgi:hypothetical protein
MHAAAAAVAFGPVIAWHSFFMLLVLVDFFYGDFILVQKRIHCFCRQDMETKHSALAEP